LASPLLYATLLFAGVDDPPAPVPTGPEAASQPDQWTPPINLRGRDLFDILDPFPLAVLHLQLPINTLEVLREPSPLNKSRNYLALGFKWEFLDGMRLELSVIENLVPPFENSSDIALGTGFSFDL
jgi:hypothetical protein